MPHCSELCVLLGLGCFYRIHASIVDSTDARGKHTWESAKGCSRRGDPYTCNQSIVEQDTQTLKGTVSKSCTTQQHSGCQSMLRACWTRCCACTLIMCVPWGVHTTTCCQTQQPQAHVPGQQQSSSSSSVPSLAVAVMRNWSVRVYVIQLHWTHYIIWIPGAACCAAACLQTAGRIA